MKKTAIKIIVAASVVTSQTACSSMINQDFFTGDEQGSFLLKADKVGMESFGDALAGIAQVSKDSPDQKGAYWLKRDGDNQVRALKWGYKTRGNKND